MANETIIDLLTIEDEQKRKEKFERVLKKSGVLHLNPYPYKRGRIKMHF